jgi:hypothetical protein
MSESPIPWVPGLAWELPKDSPIKAEWAIFRRELSRLLAEGHEGRWVLVKGEEITGVFDTQAEALSTGQQRFGAVPVLIHQILRWYRPLRQGYLKRCQP